MAIEDTAKKAMDATGETGANTRMGLSPRRRNPPRGAQTTGTSAKTGVGRRDPEEGVAREKAMNAAAAEKKEGRAAKKEGVMGSFKEGREDSAASIERQQELQAVPKADEFENINLAEVFGL